MRVGLIVGGIVGMLILAGCEPIRSAPGASKAAPAKKGSTKPTPQRYIEWQEDPFRKVRVSMRRDGRAGADAWIETEAGATLVATYRSQWDRSAHAPTSVYVLRKDKTRVSLPLEVHTENGAPVKIRCYHMTVKGKEINFLQP